MGYDFLSFLSSVFSNLNILNAYKYLIVNHLIITTIYIHLVIPSWCQ